MSSVEIGIRIPVPPDSYLEWPCILSRVFTKRAPRPAGFRSVATEMSNASLTSAQTIDALLPSAMQSVAVLTWSCTIC